MSKNESNYKRNKYSNIIKKSNISEAQKSKNSKNRSMNDNILKVSNIQSKRVFYQFYINDNQKNKNEYKHKNNYISTTKYNFFTFLPKSLFLQFTRLPNIYFLFIAIIQSIPSISPLTSVTAILPLVFVLSVSMLRELIEDIDRYKYDKTSNTRPVELLQNNKFIKTVSSEIEVGNIIKIKENEEFPCDMILLDSTNKGGVCYIETGSLDGEKNLKSKFADKNLKSNFYINAKLDENNIKNVDVTELKNYENIKGDIECNMPNPELYSFDGKMKLSFCNSSDEFVLSVTQLLLKGALLRQTKEVIGICVYTGKNNKILLNTKSHLFKTSRLEELMNHLLIFIFILEILLCIICAISHHIYNKNNRNFYINFIFQGNILNKFKDESFLSFFTYLLLLNTMIPISLIVTIEIVKVIQGFFIGFDCELYSHERKKFCKANSVSIIEELGKIDYIFSDKTGTLTCNKMEFKYCIIGNSCYQYIRKRESDNNAAQKDSSIRIPVDLREDDNDNEQYPSKFISSELLYRTKEAKVDENDNENDKSKLRLINNYVYPKTNVNNETNEIFSLLNKKQMQIRPIKVYDNYFINNYPIVNNKCLIEDEFFYSLSIGNEVIPCVNKNNEIEYTGLSPDDIELVKAASKQGFKLIDSSHEYKTVKVGNNIEKYEILNLFGFTSDRKRMSIIVKCPNGQIKMYTKGADTEIKNRLKLDQDKMNYNVTVDCSEYFSQKGFRNLFVAMKLVSDLEYESFAKKLKECELNLENKQKLVNKCISEMESNYTLLGATIVEDKLQENVPSTIKDLRNAGIKIWMLTGDKIDTAENISLSCNLISQTQKSFKIYPMTKKENKTLTKNYHKLSNNPDSSSFIPELESFLLEYNSFISDKSNEQKKFSLLVESSLLSKIFENDNKTKEFIEIAMKAESVICCRVSPLQKSLVVQKVKAYNKEVVTLAIGDGGNDVSMILEAHVGIGIHGEEGVLAIQSSDFSIGEFQYLKRLLFFHGRNSLNRTGNMVNYFFYKNFVFTIVQFYFCFYNIGSGQTLIDDWFITLYNLIFTSLPLATQALTNFDVLETDSELSILLMPRLYYETKQKGTFTILSFFITIIKGILYSALDFFIILCSVKQSALNKSGNYSDIWSNSVTLYTVVIYTVSFSLIIKQTYIVGLFMFIILISSWCCYSVFLIIAEKSTIFNSSGSIKKTANSSKFYMNFIFLIGISFVIDYAEHAYEYLFSDSIYTLLMQNKNTQNYYVNNKLMKEIQCIKGSTNIDSKKKKAIKYLLKDDESEIELRNMNKDISKEKMNKIQIENSSILKKNLVDNEDNISIKLSQREIKEPDNIHINNNIIYIHNKKGNKSFNYTSNIENTEISLKNNLFKSKTIFKKKK